VRAQAFVQHLSSVPAGRAPDKGGRDAPGGTPLATVSGVRSSCDTMPMNAGLGPLPSREERGWPGCHRPEAAICEPARPPVGFGHLGRTASREPGAVAADPPSAARGRRRSRPSGVTASRARRP
jgi:hypothetical protein